MFALRILAVAHLSRRKCNSPRIDRLCGRRRCALAPCTLPMSDSGFGGWLKRHLLPVVLAPLGVLVVSLATLFVSNITKRSPLYYQSAFGALCDGYDFLGPRKPNVVVLFPGDPEDQQRYKDFLAGLEDSRVEETLLKGVQRFEPWIPGERSIATFVKDSTARLRDRGDVGVVICVGTEIVEALVASEIQQVRIAALVTSREVLPYDAQQVYRWSFDVGDARALRGAIAVARELAASVHGASPESTVGILRGRDQKSSAWVRKTLLAQFKGAASAVRFIVGLEQQSCEDMIANDCADSAAYLVLHDREMLAHSREIAAAACKVRKPLVTTAVTTLSTSGGPTCERPAAVYGIDYRVIGGVAGDEVLCAIHGWSKQELRTRRADEKAYEDLAASDAVHAAGPSLQTGDAPAERTVTVDLAVLGSLRQRNYSRAEGDELKERLAKTLAEIGCFPAILIEE